MKKLWKEIGQGIFLAVCYIWAVALATVFVKSTLYVVVTVWHWLP